jgi:hypothetical protein
VGFIKQTNSSKKSLGQNAVSNSFDENKSAEKVNASSKTLSAHTVLLHSWVCNKTSSN